MATVPFRRSEEQFWEMSLRLLVSMIREHEKAVRNQAKMVGYMTACLSNGKDPDEGLVKRVSPRRLRKRELQMGDAMW
jgi:hypothetical protein